MCIKKLSALAFIPLEDAVSVYKELADRFEDDDLPVITYFEIKWIVNVIGRRGRHSPPHLPPKMWSVDGRHQQGTTRTNNVIEAFNHMFNSLLSCHHSSVWTLIKSLRRKQALTENTHAHISRRDMKQPSAKEATRNTRITIIVQSYISSDPDNILRGIAFNYFMQFCIKFCIKLDIIFKIYFTFNEIDFYHGQINKHSILENKCFRG